MFWNFIEIHSYTLEGGPFQDMHIFKIYSFSIFFRNYELIRLVKFVHPLLLFILAEVKGTHLPDGPKKN